MHNRAGKDPIGSETSGRRTAAPDICIDRLKTIWSEALGLGSCGADDDFFKAGGHSLSAARIASEVRRQFGIIIPVSAVYRHPTINTFAEVLQQYSRTPGHTPHKASADNKRKAKAYPAQGILPKTRPDPGTVAAAPASHSQKRFWLLEAMLRGQPVYNVPSAVILRGHLDLKAFSRAMNEVIRREDILRSGVRASEGDIEQFVIRAKPVRVVPRACSHKDALREIQADAKSPFSLDRPPLYRLKLFHTGQDTHVFYFNFHHAITDGVSTALFMEQLSGWYNYYSAQTGRTPPSPATRYSEYALRQGESLQNSLLKKQEDYWHARLSDGFPRTELLPDFPEAGKLDVKGDKVDVRLPLKLSRRISDFCAEHRITPFVFFQACLKILVARQTKTSDIVLNIIASGRTSSECEETLGCFVNTLPIRDNISEKDSFIKFLKDVGTGSGEALDNQDYPFDLIVSKLGQQHTEGQTPLSEVGMAFQNHRDPFREGLFMGIKVQQVPVGTGTSMFEALFVVEPRAGGRFSVSCEYRTSKFKHGTIKKLLGYYLEIMRGGMNTPLAPLHELKLASQPEDSSKPAKAAPEEKNSKPQECPHVVFERLAKKNPNAVALDTGKGRVYYGEVNEQANQLARHLLGSGVKSGQILAVSAERGKDFIIGMLAVLKAGCAYLPVEPSSPPKRLLSILRGSGAAGILLGHDRFGQELDGFRSFHLSPALWKGYSASDLNVRIDPRSMMYIIYTSGSTGEPKGVMISHASAMGVLKNLSLDHPSD